MQPNTRYRRVVFLIHEKTENFRRMGTLRCVYRYAVCYNFLSNYFYFILLFSDHTKICLIGHVIIFVACLVLLKAPLR